LEEILGSRHVPRGAKDEVEYRTAMTLHERFESARFAPSKGEHQLLV
jgi:hypothetical protein